MFYKYEYISYKSYDSFSPPKPYQMAIIPDDIISQILLCLPSYSLVRFKRVCKSWKHHIENPEFIQHHYLHHSLELEPEPNNLSLISTRGSSLFLHNDIDNLFLDHPTHHELPLPRSFQHNNNTIQVVGSSNGLLCMASGQGLNHYFLCNPSFPDPRNIKILPFARNRLSENCLGRRFEKQQVTAGFGYDNRGGDDYKIVYVSYCGYYYRETEVMLFSLKAGSWKPINSPPEIIGEWSCNNALLDNSLHWAVSNGRNVKIIKFDLHNEEWGEIPFFDLENGCVFDDIFVLGKSLGVLVTRGKNKTRNELWVMKEYGVKESWSVFCYDIPIRSCVIMYSLSRRQLLLYGEKGLTWYSVEEKRVIQEVEVEEISGAKVFLGSLFPVLTSKKLGHHKDE